MTPALLDAVTKVFAPFAPSELIESNNIVSNLSINVCTRTHTRSILAYIFFEFLISWATLCRLLSPVPTGVAGKVDRLQFVPSANRNLPKLAWKVTGLWGTVRNSYGHPPVCSKLTAAPRILAPDIAGEEGAHGTLSLPLVLNVYVNVVMNAQPSTS